MLSCFSRVRLFVTLWTVACQDPLFMGFPRQEYWSGLPFPAPGDLPNPGMEPMSLTSPAMAGEFFTTAAAAAAAKSLQSCPTPCNPIDGSPPGSPIPGILQARTLEWVAIAFSYEYSVCVLVTQLCPALCNPMDCSPLDSSVHGILQARILE